MNSKIVGQLIPTEYDPDFFYSEPFAIPYFDNTKLKVGFIEAQYQDYFDAADEVLKRFIGQNSSDRLNDSDLVYNYYFQTLNYGYAHPLNIRLKKDIWNFVTPTEIIIYWNENSDFYLCVSCECEWEEEHGLQLVFTNGQTLTRASGHDGHFVD